MAARFAQPLNAWSGPAPRRASALLLAIAAGALFLNAAATVEAGFTLQMSYLATAGAVVVGAPFVLRGWTRLPGSARAAAAGLLAAYALAAILGDPQGLAGASRSSHRVLLYVGDLGLGLAAVGLVAGLADTPERVRWGAVVLAGGAVLGAIVCVYQWVALHFGWPLSDINSAPNSDGFSTGHRYQGAGLIGWERARGTFKEPLYLGVFLATAVPLLVGLARRGGRRWLAMLGIAGVGLLLTVSSLAWGVLLLCGAAAVCVYAVSAGRARLARAAGIVFALAVMLAPLAFIDPGRLSTLTGRSGKDLRATAVNRASAWQRAVGVWEDRPVVGTGPGQSSVRLAYRPAGSAVAPGLRAPVVLGSAQGLWAASLIDGGLLTLMAWSFLFGTLLLPLVRSCLARPDPLLLGILTAAGVAVLAAQLAGDRLEVRVWLVLGLAAAGGALADQAGHAGQQADEAAQQ